MADTNQVQLSYVEETTFGSTPASALTDLRITGETLSLDITSIQSNEIRNDRMIDDLIQQSAEPGGGFDFEFSYESPPDTFFEAALCTTWGQSAAGTAVDYSSGLNDISFAAADNSINDANSGFVTAGIRAGQWLRVSGNATAANNTLHKVLSVVAAKIVCTNDTTIVTDDGTLDTVVIKGTVNIATIALDAGDANGVYTDDAIDMEDEGIRVGQWVEIRGFTTPANNGYKLVTAVSGVTFTTLQTTVLEVQGDSVTVKGNMIRNDNVNHFYSIQRELVDAVQFFNHRGMTVNTLAITVTADEIVTGSLDFMGATVATTDLAQTTHGTGANTAAPTNDAFTAISNVASIMEGATLAAIAADLYVQELSFSLNNNLRGKKAIGTFGNAATGMGTCDVTGSMNVLFNDETLYDKYLAGTETALTFKCEDSSGNAYIFTFHAVKFETDDGGKATGLDADVVENIAWKAIRDVTYDCVIQIDKFPA